MKTVILNVVAAIVFVFGITVLFVWESAATKADKEIYQQAAEGHESMY